MKNITFDKKSFSYFLLTRFFLKEKKNFHSSVRFTFFPIQTHVSVIKL